MESAVNSEVESKEMYSNQSQNSANTKLETPGCSTSTPETIEVINASSTSDRKRKRASSTTGAQTDSHCDDEDSGDPKSEVLKEETPSSQPVKPIKTSSEEILKTFNKPSGVLLMSGHVSWDLVGRREGYGEMPHRNLYTFHKFTDRRYQLIASGCAAGHSILISEDGDTYSFGRNTFGQLGQGDTVTRFQPEIIPKLLSKNVVQAAAGSHHTLFVTDKGVVYACGKNTFGQCGVGTDTRRILVPTRIKYRGAPIVKVGCGSVFSIILDANGVLYAFGMSEYGQLGLYRDKRNLKRMRRSLQCVETVPKQITTFIHKSKIGYSSQIRNVNIADFSCGKTYTVAIDSKKRAFSWGYGGHRQLGYSEDDSKAAQWTPRLIKYFEAEGRGMASVHCGGIYTLAINEHGSLMRFGQTDESRNIDEYPKQDRHLTGLNIKSVGISNNSALVATEDTLIAWGDNSCFGELGLGKLEMISSQPKEVPFLKGLNIMQIAMGYSHTLLLCDDSKEEAVEHLATIPTYEP